MDSPSSAVGNGGIQIISRAAQVLRALASEPEGLSLSQLAQRVELPRSTVHRIVTALAVENLVAAASPTGRVRLGPELSRLAATSRRDLWQDLRPYMQDLFDAFGETVDCAVLDGDQVRFVDQILSRQGLRAVSAVGSRFPLYCTANGKALLATLEDDQIFRLLPARLEPLTPHTLTSRDALLAELESVRETGVAYDREEHMIGIVAAGIAVGAPYDSIAALSIPMPTHRFYDREREIEAALQDVLRRANAALGFS